MHQAYKKAAVLAIITLLGWGGIHSYYRYTQDMIYQESTDSLRATYTQVGTSFRLFTQRNWNILSVYEKNIQLLPAEYRTNEQWKVLLGERSQWKYRDFYLFDQAGNYVTDSGHRGQRTASKRPSKMFTRQESRSSRAMCRRVACVGSSLPCLSKNL